MTNKNILESLGITDYPSYMKYRMDIFEIVERILEEYCTKHPEFIEQAVQNYIKEFVEVKDLSCNAIGRSW